MPPETCRVDLQRNKTSLHIVTSVGYSTEYYDARNNKYKICKLILYKYGVWVGTGFVSGQKQVTGICEGVSEVLVI